MDPSPQFLLTEAEAARMLGLTPRCLQSWRHRGGPLPHIRISARCIRYRVEDLHAFAAERLRMSTSDPGESEAA